MAKHSSHRIEVEGIKKVKRALKRLGKTTKESRSLVNKALRPAAEIAKKALKNNYKFMTKTKTPGVRYDASTQTKVQGKSIADSIGLKTAKHTRFPSIYVGVILKRVTPTWVADGDGGVPEKSRNLAAMLIDGTKERFHKSGKSVGRIEPMHDYPSEVAKKKGSQMASTAQRDISKMLDKLIREVGLK